MPAPMRTTVLAAFVVAGVVHGSQARAQSQPTSTHSTALAVVRDYDGRSLESVAPVHAPLEIARDYDDRDVPASSPATNVTPHLTPWDGNVAATASSNVPPVAVVRVYDDTADAIDVVRPIHLVNYDGSDIVFSTRDPAVHLLTVITDFDADAHRDAAARVYIAYDASGAIVHVETALPTVSVSGTGVGSSSAQGPTVVMGGVESATRAQRTRH
jgi:hypothetical protein